MRWPQRARSTRSQLDWTPVIAAMFGPLEPGSTPPSSVTVFRSADGRRWTFTARFKLSDGGTVKATARFRRDDHAGLVPVDETLEGAS